MISNYSTGGLLNCAMTGRDCITYSRNMQYAFKCKKTQFSQDRRGKKVTFILHRLKCMHDYIRRYILKYCRYVVKASLIYESYLMIIYSSYKTIAFVQNRSFCDSNKNITVIPAFRIRMIECSAINTVCKFMCLQDYLYVSTQRTQHHGMLSIPVLNLSPTRRIS